MTKYEPKLLDETTISRLRELLSQKRKSEPRPNGHLARINMADMMSAADPVMKEIVAKFSGDAEAAKPTLYEMIEFFNTFYLSQFPATVKETALVFIGEMESLDLSTHEQEEARTDLINELKNIVARTESQEFKLHEITDIKFPAIRLMTKLKSDRLAYEQVGEISMFGTFVGMNFKMDNEQEEAPAPKM